MGAAVIEKQVRHLILPTLLLAGVGWVSRVLGLGEGSFRGVSTPVWFWWSIAFPIIHQVWVVICWRLELHHQWLTRNLGKWGFRIYGAEQV